MTTKAFKEAIKRVESWPRERQDAAARMLIEMEAQTSAGYQLTNEQVAEVRRRLADPNPRFITLAEAWARLSSTGS